jgi:cytoskeletal protein RodZ
VSAQDTLRERYGAPAPWRRRAVIAASALVAAVFLGWLAWTVYEHSTPEVTSELESFSIEDDHSATAVLVVTLDSSDVEASCTLRAYATDHTTVGELTFTPDPSKGRRQVETIRTERRATSVENIGCTAPGQDRPR